jgi:DNA-directed RNA polymerase subunit beta
MATIDVANTSTTSDLSRKMNTVPVTSFSDRSRPRRMFGKIREVADMPNLIEVQMASYNQFLMVDDPEGGRNDDEGLQSVFKSVFPISDFAGTAMLQFVRYEFEPPKYDVDECRQRGMTFRRR